MTDMMINPLLINKIGSESFEGFFIRQRISLPTVIALTKLRESIVDISVARIPIMNRPKNP